MLLDSFSQAAGQGWPQIADLVLAFALSSAIGFEREARQRSAGLRTYTLVGVGSALIMLVSKYGFGDVLGAQHVTLDPSRVAAQVVSGIGFIGGGLIFVRRDAVRGLTTAAAAWLTAAIGLACGAGLPILAVAGTGAYFIVVVGYTPLVRRVPGGGRAAGQLRLEYVERRGVLRRALQVCGSLGFTVSDLSVIRAEADGHDHGRDERRDRSETHSGGHNVVTLTMTVEGNGSLPSLVSALSELDHVVAVSAGDPARD